VRIFISWSGEPSGTVALALRRWLPRLLQFVEPWMSTEEIQSGSLWRDELAKALDDTNFGIICVTRNNQDSRWLMFEAGALAKSVTVGRVVPLCVDLRPSELQGPLSAFQARTLDRDQIYRLVRDINKGSDRGLGDRTLARLFELEWPEFEARIAHLR
jgi:TIR domain